MTGKPQRFVSTRKMPRQVRARRTIEVIYEATARIIEREGVGKLTTNQIASRAGVSIGTLYEYFPNKEAVIVAMARRQLADDEQELSIAIVKALATPDTSLVRHVVRS
jgi:AcrR family transcriptional regulator